MLRRTMLKALMFAPVATLVKPDPVEATLQRILDRHSPLYLSPEAHQDLKNWGCDQVGHATLGIGVLDNRDVLLGEF